MDAPIEIVPYDRRWPSLYQQERRRILEALPPAVVLAIEHVGSTAVPGLPAKPIIDIMVAIAGLAKVPACCEPLRHLGYEYRPEYEAKIPERRFFRKGSLTITHHLHMVELDSAFWARLLLFRDFLRQHPDVAEQYCQLKRRLAQEYGSDRSGYSDAKTGFIAGVEAQARLARMGSHG